MDIGPTLAVRRFRNHLGKIRNKTVVQGIGIYHFKVYTRS
jgi:hypothetical protein